MRSPPLRNKGWTRVEEQIRGLCRAIGAGGMEAEAVEIHSRMRRVCKLREPGEPARWSGVTDDSTPFEYSVAFQQSGARLRFLFEPQNDPATAASYWQAAKRCTRLLKSTWNANITPALAIEDLFEPRVPVFLSAGHGVELYSGRPAGFKVYFNAMARGTDHSAQLVGQALER